MVSKCEFSLKCIVCCIIDWFHVAGNISNLGMQSIMLDY